MTFEKATFNLKQKNCYKVGQLSKPFAYKGQIYVKNFIDFIIDKKGTVFIEIDKYLVPFFIDYEQSSLKNYPIILKFQDIDTPEVASLLNGNYIYLPKSDIQDIAEKITDFENFIVGYKLFQSATNVEIGTITELIDDKKNPLFSVLNEKDEELLIPINAIEYISVSHEQQELFITLPDNFLDLL